MLGTGEQFPDPALSRFLIVLMIADEAQWMNVKVREQFARVSGILAQHNVRGSQRIQQTLTHIGQIADWGGTNGELRSLQRQIVAVQPSHLPKTGPCAASSGCSRLHRPR